MKGQAWAEKDEPDYAYQLLFGIEYLRANGQSIDAFDINQKAGLGLTTTTTALPTEAIRIIQNVKSIDALYKLFTSIYKEPNLKVAVDLLQ